MASLLTFLLMVVSGWVHRRQLIVIEFLQAENRMLKERLRGKRIRHRCGTGAPRAKGEGGGAQSIAGTRHHRLSRHLDALASAAGRNAYAERFVRSIKEECLGKVIFVGQVSLLRAITEYTTHFHAERNHQRLENRLIRAQPKFAADDDVVRRRPRLGRLLNHYYRAAA
ncbi:MAG: hypothetical protein ABI790_16335 [Betaproteobacteria bacterium]